MKIPKIGTPVKVTWLDAVFYQHAHEVTKKVFEQGGEILVSIGFIGNYNRKSVVLVAECNEAGEPSRDINIIPRSLITKIEILK